MYIARKKGGKTLMKQANRSGKTIVALAIALVMIALVGMIIFSIVPASVRLSDMVYQTQASQVNETIEEYNDLEIEGDADSGLFNEFTSITTETIDKITSFIDNLMESLAVMIVTSCLIPLLVFAFLVWLVKTIFSSNILTLDTSALDALTDKLR